MSFEFVGGEKVWEGRIATVFVERFRHSDGEEVIRERMGHPGAVVIVAHDDEHVWLVRQPREAVREQGSLEIPAGKLDHAGEDELATAKRELAEEIGKTAERWEELTWSWSSPGFTDERWQFFLATGLRAAKGEHEADENERIEIVPWPLSQLDELIDECHDAKTQIGLLLLQRRRARG
jgi:ADP-ribose pyrophosphatase